METAFHTLPIYHWGQRNLLYLQANMLACPSFMDASRRHQPPRSEKRNFIIHDTAGSMSCKFMSVATRSSCPRCPWGHVEPSLQTLEMWIVSQVQNLGLHDGAPSKPAQPLPRVTHYPSRRAKKSTLWYPEWCSTYLPSLFPIKHASKPGPERKLPRTLLVRYAKP